jgi:hypothetical protein
MGYVPRSIQIVAVMTGKYSSSTELKALCRCCQFPAVLSKHTNLQIDVLLHAFDQAALFNFLTAVMTGNIQAQQN